jgi:hypothetical protein
MQLYIVHQIKKILIKLPYFNYEVFIFIGTYIFRIY